MTDNGIHPDRSIPEPDVRPTLSVREVAPILGIAVASAFRAVEKGDIPSIRIGRRILIPTAALRSMLRLDGRPTEIISTERVDRPITSNDSRGC